MVESTAQDIQDITKIKADLLFCTRISLNLCKTVFDGEKQVKLFFLY